MPRDLKIANWTWSNVTRSATAMGVAQGTPTGQPSNTQATITLGPSAAGSTFRAVSDAKNVAGFINSQMDTSSFANFISGSEISAVSGQPALWGNTSYMNMYARCSVSFAALTTGSTCTLPASAGAYIVVEGAYDNGASTPAPDGLWVPLSGAIPLVTGVAALSVSVALASNYFTTTTQHGLRVGDFIVFSAVGGLSGAGVPTAGQVYVVQDAPTATTFAIATVAAPTVALVVTGTSTGAVVQKLVSSNVGNTSTATGSKILSAPMTQSVRPWLRWALHYYTTDATQVTQVIINRTALVLGRDNAMVG